MNSHTDPLLAIKEHIINDNVLDRSVVQGSMNSRETIDHVLDVSMSNEYKHIRKLSVPQDLRKYEYEQNPELFQLIERERQKSKENNYKNSGNEWGVFWNNKCSMRANQNDIVKRLQENEYYLYLKVIIDNGKANERHKQQLLSLIRAFGNNALVTDWYDGNYHSSPGQFWIYFSWFYCYPYVKNYG